MKGQPYNLCEPADRSILEALRQKVQGYCAEQPLVAPLSREELEAHATRLLDGASLPPSLNDFTRVLIGNAVWRDAVAATPYDRRILLLPQCLKSSVSCQGEYDALGLLCAECGQCSIGAIQREAERLGYVVLVAEGTTAVTALLSRGEADAIIGVSCLHALEQSFAPLAANAIPSLAVPLLRNACADTATDLDWLFELLALRDETRRPIRIDLPELRRDVDRWFEPDAMKTLLCRTGSATETIAVDWMSKAGKRWRPLLAVGVCRALSTDDGLDTGTLRRLAVAAECFHKASLIHDDIEDEDDTRYGEQTLHRQYGIAIALNIGDLLIGEGYRLISEAGLPPAREVEMIRTAAEGHRSLCLGQGAELLLRQQPEHATVAHVLQIFQHKTAPAFDVAIQLGAIAAGGDQATRAILAAFSNAIGIAYQIQDDIEDYTAARLAPDGPENGVSVLAALAREARQPPAPHPTGAASTHATRQGDTIEVRARELQRHYAEETLRVLTPLRNAPLKCLLFRIANLFLQPSVS